MYLVLSPFFYYLAYKQEINKFIESESNCNNFTSLNRDELTNLINKFITNNSHGISEYKLNSYVDFIYRQLCES